MAGYVPWTTLSEWIRRLGQEFIIIIYLEWRIRWETMPFATQDRKLPEIGQLLATIPTPVEIEDPSFTVYAHLMASSHVRGTGQLVPHLLRGGLHMIGNASPMSLDRLLSYVTIKIPLWKTNQVQSIFHPCSYDVVKPSTALQIVVSAPSKSPAITYTGMLSLDTYAHTKWRSFTNWLWSWVRSGSSNKILLFFCKALNASE